VGLSSGGAFGSAKLTMVYKPIGIASGFAAGIPKYNVPHIVTGIPSAEVVSTGAHAVFVAKVHYGTITSTFEQTDKATARIIESRRITAAITVSAPSALILKR